jgi:hypothetical protein
MWGAQGAELREWKQNRFNNQFCPVLHSDNSGTASSFVLGMEAIRH